MSIELVCFGYFAPAISLEIREDQIFKYKM